MFDKFLIEQQIRFQKKLESFMEEERGASDMAAVMILIVIVVAVAVIFRQGLISAVQQAINKLTEFIGS